MRQIFSVLVALLAADWPGSDFTSRFPNHAENDSATRLMATASRLSDGRHNDAATLRTLRAQIITSPLPIWAQQIDDVLEPPTPPLSLHIRLFRTLGV
ncbi:MAG: hypothetical protein DMF59_13840, partial [Acidobacteria bacterium]